VRVAIKHQAQQLYFDGREHYGGLYFSKSLFPKRNG